MAHGTCHSQKGGEADCSLPVHAKQKPCPQIRSTFLWERGSERFCFGLWCRQSSRSIRVMILTCPVWIVHGCTRPTSLRGLSVKCVFFLFFARHHSSTVFFTLLEGKCLESSLEGAITQTPYSMIHLQYTSWPLFTNDLDHYLLPD